MEVNEETVENTPPVFKLRNIDGTVLGAYYATKNPKGYEVNPHTGRRENIAEKFTPFTVPKKLPLGLSVSTETGVMRVVKPLSPEYETKWPNSVFVERVVDQPKV